MKSDRLLDLRCKFIGNHSGEVHNEDQKAVPGDLNTKFIN